MAAEHEPRWLTEAELRTWRALSLVLARLPVALGSQLQRESGLSFLEYYALAALSDSPDRRMRMSQLAFLTNAELSRVSHLVGRLERRHLVRREPDPTDGRYTLAVMTEEGYRQLVEAAPGHVETVRRLVFDPLAAEDQQALERAACKVVARLDTDAAGAG
jgi:DNA-binding MarR family transcriptional regulator